MIRLFRWADAERPSSTRAVLRLVDLEGRAHPSGTGDAAPPPPDPPAGQEAPPPRPANQPPLIEGLNAREFANGVFVVTGRVLDERPGGLTVWLGGVTSASGYCAVTDADGYFSVTITLRTDGTDTGNLTATVTDGGGLSDEDFVYVFPTAP
jgi:hypothetical protein